LTSGAVFFVFLDKEIAYNLNTAGQMVMLMVNVNLYSAVVSNAEVTEVFNALSTLVAEEKPGF